MLLSSQIPADFLKIQGFVALLDSVFVGRLDDEEAQADALRLLKVPVGVGYEQVIAALGRRPGSRSEVERDTEPRQFIFADGAGGVERIRVDFSGPHLDHLRAALDTTPGATASSVRRPQPSGEADKGEDEQREEAPRVPEPPEPELDEEFERAAELEVGLTEEDVLAGAAEADEASESGAGEARSEDKEHAGAGKGGTGRDAA